MFAVGRTLLFLCLYHLNVAKENYKRSFGTHFLVTYPGLPYKYSSQSGFPKVIFYVFKHSDSNVVIILESLRMQNVVQLRHVFTLAESADVDSFSLPGQYITRSANDIRGTFQLRSAFVFGVNMLIIVDMQSIALVHLTSTYSWDRKYIAFTLRENPTIIIVNDHWQNKVTFIIKSDSGQEIETAKNIYHPGSTYKIHLESFESYEIADCNDKKRFDSWTGTVLEGIEYFGVISGSCESSVTAVQCDNASIMYDNDTSKDIAAEMLLPTVISGKEFITLNEPNRNAPGVLVLVAVEPETTVKHYMDNLGGTNLYSLVKQGDHKTIDATQYASFLASDKAIQVYYVMRSLCKGPGPYEIGDASVTKLIPMQLFYHIYVLYTFTITSTSDKNDYSRDYIVLIVHQDLISHMVIDGHEVSGERHWYPVVGKPGWKISHLNVLPGLHIVKSRISATYGCYTYGGSKGFGYLTTTDHSTDKISKVVLEFCIHSVKTMTPGDYEDNDCDGRSDEEIPDALDNDDDGAVDEDLQGLVGFVTTMSTRFVFSIPGMLLAHVNLESALQISMFTMQGAVVIRLSTHHFGSLSMAVLVTKLKPELISPGLLPTYDRGHKGTYSAVGNGTFGLMVSSSQTSYSLDIFTAIPVESWDRDYIAVTVGQNPSLVIVADVAVSVTVRMRRDGRHRPIAILNSNRVHVSGSNIVISLGSYQSYEISECNSKDIVATLTGSVLTGSQPFGVVSGSCRSISRGYECEQEHFGESMDFTAEMLIPKSSFGKEYIVVSYNFPEYSGELVVVASVIDTSFQIAKDNKGGADAYALDDPGDWLKLDLTNVTGLLLSNKPILVMHYFRVRCAADKFRRSDLGDPSLGLLVPSVLFFHEYAWNVFDNTEDKLSHFALAIFAARYAASLRLNSVKITMNNTRKVMGLPGWVTSSFMLPSPGVYTLESDIFAVFGLYVFGRHKQVTYLTFAGSIMSKINMLCHRTDMLVCDDIDNDCDGRIDEELLWGKDDDLDHRKSEDVCYNPQPKRRPPPDTLSTNMTLSSVPVTPEAHRFVNIKGRGTAPGSGDTRPTDFPSVQDPENIGYWSDWRCTRDCRDSNQHRHRTCLPTESLKGNKDCYNLEEKRPSHCYVGVTCPSDCSKFTWGPGCKNNCSNCQEDCDPFYGNCTRCRPGYMFPINGCPDPCDAMSYGQDCEESCFRLCGGECQDHVTGACPNIYRWYLYPLCLLILIPIALVIYLRGSYAKESH